MKKSKQAYYDKYFEINWKNNKNTWKGIKFFISFKTVISNVPTVLFLDNGDTIGSSYYIANTFNNYFAAIVETTKNLPLKIFPLKVLVHYFCNLTENK